MTDEELAIIEARVNEATPGPWSVERSSFDDRGYKQVGPLTSCDGCAISGTNDGDFVVHAREDVPALIAEVRRLRALVTCDCGKERLPGPCSDNCDRDE